MPIIKQLSNPSFVEIDGKYYIENVCFDGNKFTISDFNEDTHEENTLVHEIIGLGYCSDTEYQEVLPVNTTPIITTLANTITLDDIFDGCKVVYTYTKEATKDLIKEELYLSDAVKAALPPTVLPNVGLLIKTTSTLNPTIDDVEITDISLSTDIENSIDTTTQINYKKTAEDNPRFWFETGVAIDSLLAEETITKKYFDVDGDKYLFCGVSNAWLNASVGEVIIDPTTGKTSTYIFPLRRFEGRNFVLDSNDRCHLVYIEASGGLLSHTYTDDYSAWSSNVTVEATAWAVGALKAGGDVGTDLHCVYTETAEPNSLYYRAYSGGLWKGAVPVPDAEKDPSLEIANNLLWCVANKIISVAQENIYISNHSLSDHTAAWSASTRVCSGADLHKRGVSVSNPINNVIYISWEQETSQGSGIYNIHVRSFNTSTLVFGTDTVVAASANNQRYNPSIVLLTDGTPHLVFGEYGRGSGGAYWDIKHVWLDGTWQSEWITTEGENNDESCYFPMLSTNPNTNRLYVIYEERETPYKARLLEFNGSTWESVVDLTEGTENNALLTCDKLIKNDTIYYGFRYGNASPYTIYFNTLEVDAGAIPININNIAQGQSTTSPTLAQKIALTLDNINQSQDMGELSITQLKKEITAFEQSYIDLLLKQYWQQGKAPAEIRMQAGTWQKIIDWLRDFLIEFDIDNATGDRLDIIGRIVGLNRIVPLAVPKIAFGFNENDNARGFDDKFISVVSAPFADKFERAYTDLQLDDNNFRFFIKSKISKNIGSPYLADDNGLSMQEVVNTLFSGEAYVVDRKNMKMVLWVTPEYDEDILRVTILLNLLPKPHGVKWAGIILNSPDDTFGFSENLTAQPFANKFDTITEPGGIFAEKILIE